jgi:hypothetical protein
MSETLEEKRESCIFYRGFYDAIKHMPKDDKAIIYDAYFEYALNNNEVELEGMVKVVFALMKPQIDANTRKHAAWKENGKMGASHGIKGGRPSNNPQITPNKPQVNPKLTPGEPLNVNVNVNDNVNDNVNHNVNDNENVNEIQQQNFLSIFQDDFESCKKIAIQVGISPFHLSTAKRDFIKWVSNSPPKKTYDDLLDHFKNWSAKNIQLYKTPAR